MGGGGGWEELGGRGGGWEELGGRGGGKKGREMGERVTGSGSQ